MTELIAKFYEQEGKPTMKENQRTVAFQVSTELFDQFKGYLKRKGIKQNAFFLDCIQRALEEENQAENGVESE
jgi:type III secretory pathway component EscR